MDEKVLYRNPSTGLVEVKEFTSQVSSHLRWVRDASGAIQKHPKEFAGNSQLGLLRIADPVLTTISQGYQQQEGMIGNELFPEVKTAKESGRFPAFGKEAFIIPTDIKRGIGGKVARMDVQTGWIQTSLSEYALGFDIDNREINEWAGTGDQILVGRQKTLDSKIALVREQNQSILATTTGSYTTGYAMDGAGKAWATTGNPITDCIQLINLVRKSNGQVPDLFWFTPTAWWLFTNNQKVIDRIKFGGTPMAPADLYIAGQAAVAKLLGVKKVLVAWAVFGTGGTGGFNQADLTMDYLWENVNGACAGCCITGLGWMVPSFGYTYVRLNSPIVESWYDNSVKSMKYDTEHFFDAAVTKTDAGGVYTNLA